MVSVSRWSAAFSGTSVAVLTYHHFASHDEPATRHLGMTTSPERFQRQLDFVLSRYQVIGLDEVLSGRIPGNAALITIDDAYRSVLEIAAPILKARNLRAVLFANPRPIVEPFVLTDHLLSLVRCERGGEARIDAAVRWVLGDPGGGDTPPLSVNQLTLDRIAEIKALLLHELGLTEGDLHRQLALYLAPSDLAVLEQQGIEIANHTMSHTLCRTLSPAELGSEILGAKDVLDALTRQPVRAFAFPWGQEQDASPVVLAAIRGSGHLATFLMHSRRNAVRPASDIWYRTLASNQTAARLGVDLELLPRLRALV